MNQPNTETPVTSAGEKRFPCGQCGAKLEYKPGSTVLKCPYCPRAPITSIEKIKTYLLFRRV